jgi:predicted LPLAT superfamily acyltransferase/predicted hotdog family 3-hydroxylacyl-ACP dehydratase
MSQQSHWSAMAERGSMAALRVMAWGYRVLGRWFCQLLLYPAVIYFFLADGRGRRASRAYLERIHERRGGAAGRRPGRFAPLRHYFEFAVQLLDRMVLWGGGLSGFRMDHHGSEHLFALARARRGAILLGAQLGSCDMARELAGAYDLVLNVVMYTAHAERINRFFEHQAPESHVRVLQLDPHSVRAAFEIKACLDRGELVGILADRIPAGGRERPLFVDFLGRRAPFPSSPFLLACLLGCPTYLALEGRGGDRPGLRAPARGDLPALPGAVVQLLRRVGLEGRRLRGGFPPLAELLPQAGPMRLLDRILEHDASGTRCLADPARSALFCDAGERVPAWVGIEYMAQCTAAHGGLLARARGEAPRPGLFVGSRRLRFRCEGFEAGQLLEVEARHAAGHGARMAFDCAVRLPGLDEPLVEGRINIVLLAPRGDAARGAS